MKRIKSINGYTIYQASARDASKYNVTESYFYLYFSSDIRDYGLSNCDWDWEAGSIEEAEAFATGTNYAIAKEIVEETTTAASFEEIAAVEAKLDSGMSREATEESYPEIATDLYLEYIRKALEDGIQTADIMNKMALEVRSITIYQYSAAARLIVAAYLAS